MSNNLINKIYNKTNIRFFYHNLSQMNYQFVEINIQQKNRCKININ